MVVLPSVAYPGSGSFFTPDPRSGENNSEPGSGMNVPDPIYENLVSVFALKILKLFNADPDRDP
jgi:hypothetical protein